MAKIRSIHPDTCESETLASLSATAERTFWRLLPHTDDEGRGRYQPVVLRNKLYAASTTVTAEQVEADLMELADAGLIRVYLNGKKRFYHVRSWAEFQKPKYKSESSLPGPDDPDSTLDGTGPGPDLDPIESTPVPDLPNGEGEGEGVGDGESSSPNSESPDPDVSDSARANTRLLAERIKANGFKLPAANSKANRDWLKAMDKLERLDGADPSEIRRVVEWSTADEFWQSNIRSAPKFRDQFPQLRLRMLNSNGHKPDWNSANRPPEDVRADGSRRGVM